MEQTDLLRELKKLVVVAMFSDDEFFDELVLKGGNAMDLIHRLSSRASVDLDFSMQHDFVAGLDIFRHKIERALVKTFRPNGYEVFDVKMSERPPEISQKMKDFWGGYKVEFKLATSSVFHRYQDDIEQLRRHSINLGQGSKFLIDISRFEWTHGKQAANLDGFEIFVYSPQMIVCEKLRAICQQLPEYSSIVRRDRHGARGRARDFIDIHVLVDALKLNIGSQENRELLSEIFGCKRVPLSLLGKIENQRELHRTDFPSVQATIKRGLFLKDFDFYFDFVLTEVAKLKTLWNV